MIPSIQSEFSTNCRKGFQWGHLERKYMVPVQLIYATQYVKECQQDSKSFHLHCIILTLHEGVSVCVNNDQVFIPDEFLYLLLYIEIWTNLKQMQLFKSPNGSNFFKFCGSCPVKNELLHRTKPSVFFFFAAASYPLKIAAAAHS